MNVVSLSQWQFAVTVVYHFFFVPLTLGLSILVAIMETIYVRSGQAIYKDMAKFWGKLFLINFAMGVVTGIVHGVPVRHELGQLLPFRGRYLRRSTGDRSLAGFLPGIDLPGALGVRLG